MSIHDRPESHAAHIQARADKGRAWQEPQPCCGRRGRQHWPTCTEKEKEMRDPDYYPSIEAYTADVIAARDAYRADQLAAEGICPTCEKNQRDDHSQCRACREGRRA